MNPFRIGDYVLSEQVVGSLEVLDVKDEHVLTGWGWFHYKKVVAEPSPFRDMLEKLERHEVKTEQSELASVTNIKQGIKYDQEKPDLSLLQPEFLNETAKAFMYGANKYGRYNYLAGMDWHRLVAAALRHITAFNSGEDHDSESGLSHLGHAAACISMLITYKTKMLGKDTRHKP